MTTDELMLFCAKDDVNCALQQPWSRDWKPQDNRTPYEKGRRDQRRVDRIVAIVCLVFLAIYITWRG